MLLLMSIGLSACETSTLVTSDFCQAYKPITVVREKPNMPMPKDPFNVIDSPVTVMQVDANNGAYECSCNRDCPPEAKR